MCLLLFIYINIELCAVGKQDRINFLRDRACATTRAHCCEDCCIVNNIGYEKGKQLVYDCMVARDTMTRAENKNDLRAIINVSIVYLPCHIANLLNYSVGASHIHRHAAGM